MFKIPGLKKVTLCCVTGKKLNNEPLKYKFEEHTHKASCILTSTVSDNDSKCFAKFYMRLIKWNSPSNSAPALQQGILRTFAVRDGFYICLSCCLYSSCTRVVATISITASLNNLSHFRRPYVSDGLLNMGFWIINELLLLSNQNLQLAATITSHESPTIVVL